MVLGGVGDRGWGFRWRGEHSVSSAAKWPGTGAGAGAGAGAGGDFGVTVGAFNLLHRALL